jgi:histidinol phosphatase-like PHP family hydrolase
MRTRRVWSIQSELLEKAKESALASVKIYNDPLIKFKSESFIVLMMIAWTYLLHSYYRRIKIDYRYFEQKGKRKKYDKTKRGAYKYWELERCLNEKKCPIDKDTANNLKFLIGLRHEIEHQMTLNLDDYLSGRYQACILNFNSYLKSFFGVQNGLDNNLNFSLQFIEFSEEQILGGKPETDIPQNLKAYIVDFDKNLAEEEYNSPRFSYSVLFSRKLVNRPGQANKVFEFIDPNSELAKTIDKEYWVKKEVEKTKYRAKSVVAAVKNAGFTKFRITEHTVLWKNEDAKNEKKGYGVNIEGTWFWYNNWIEKCIELCSQEADKYK